MSVVIRGGAVKVVPPLTPIHDDHYDVDVYPSTHKNPTLDIMVPVHGNLHLTIACINSIYQFTHVPFHLIVCNDAPISDNGLTEQYIRNLQKERTNITYCHSNIPYKCGNTFFNIFS